MASCRERLLPRQVAARSYKVLLLWHRDQSLLHHGAKRLVASFRNPHLALGDGQRAAGLDHLAAGAQLLAVPGAITLSLYSTVSTPLPAASGRTGAAAGGINQRGDDASMEVAILLRKLGPEVKLDLGNALVHLRSAAHRSASWRPVR